MPSINEILSKTITAASYRRSVVVEPLWFSKKLVISPEKYNLFVKN
jgi:hypothetical protein